MSPEEAIVLIVQRAEADPELAAALRTVLTGVLAKLPEPIPELELAPAPEPVFSPAVEDMDERPLEAPRDPEPTHTQWDDLDVVAARLGLKAKAARWVARHGYTEQQGALNERYALLDEARTAGVYIWLFDRNRVDPRETDALHEIADLLELTTQALGFWQRAGGSPEEGAADQLLAEVQAALRTAAWNLAGYTDEDQFALYRTLKLNAQVSRTYLPQLGLSYRSQPAAVLEAELTTLQNAKKAREETIIDVERAGERVRRCVRSVLQSPDYLGRWRKLERALEELLELGGEVPHLELPTDLELPGGLPLLSRLLAKPDMLVVQDDIPWYVADGSAEIIQARTLLSGRVMLIVGGDRRSEAVARLEAAFACTVRWQETAPHTSLDVLEPVITDEVAVVLLLIRWSSHIYQELAQTCKAQGVPLVRVSGGYSPNRVAHDVLEQAEARLSASRRSKALPDVQ